VFHKKGRGIMKKLLVLLVAGSAFLFTMVTAGGAFGGDGNSIEGEVQNISANILTIRQEEPEQVSLVIVEVNPETEFEQVDSLAELSEGDRVKVDYRQEDNRNIATKVSLQEPQSPDPVATM
jgi:hypothetical protein